MGIATYVTISGCKNYGFVAASSESGYAGGIAGEENCTNHASSITGKLAGYLARYADVDTNNYSSNSGNENKSGNSSLEWYGFLPKC